MWDIEQLDVSEMYSRSGGQELGYVEPGEAAMEMLEEVLEPFVEDVRRQGAMGLHDAALESCQAILLGLYRADRESHTDFLGWVPDGLAEFADEAILALRGTARGSRGRASRLPRALRDFARENLHDWTWLHG